MTERHPWLRMRGLAGGKTDRREEGGDSRMNDGCIRMYRHFPIASHSRRGPENDLPTMIAPSRSRLMRQISQRHPHPILTLF